jgi:hypothetical protein
MNQSVRKTLLFRARRLFPWLEEREAQHRIAATGLGNRPRRWNKLPIRFVQQPGRYSSRKEAAHAS